MHNFDDEQRGRQDNDAEDHEFTLRGEVFSIRRVIPYAVLRQLSGIGVESSDNDALAAVEFAVLSMLTGGKEAKDRFQNVITAVDDFPVTYSDLLEVQDWMIREATGRPPTQPEASSDSSGTNGNPSTETSSDEPAEVSRT
jgi:hypothetical protein